MDLLHLCHWRELSKRWKPETIKKDIYYAKYGPVLEEHKDGIDIWCRQKKHIYFVGEEKNPKVYRSRDSVNPSLVHPSPPPLSPGMHSRGISAICNADTTGCPQKNELHLLPVRLRVCCLSLFVSIFYDAAAPFSHSLPLPLSLWLSVWKELEKNEKDQYWRITWWCLRLKLRHTPHTTPCGCKNSHWGYYL